MEKKSSTALDNKAKVKFSKKSKDLMFKSIKGEQVEVKKKYYKPKINSNEMKKKNEFLKKRKLQILILRKKLKKEKDNLIIKQSFIKQRGALLEKQKANKGEPKPFEKKVNPKKRPIKYLKAKKSGLEKLYKKTPYIKRESIQNKDKKKEYQEPKGNKRPLKSKIKELLLKKKNSGTPIIVIKVKDFSLSTFLSKIDTRNNLPLIDQEKLERAWIKKYKGIKYKKKAKEVLSEKEKKILIFLKKKYWKKDKNKTWAYPKQRKVTRLNKILWFLKNVRLEKDTQLTKEKKEVLLKKLDIGYSITRKYH